MASNQDAPYRNEELLRKKYVHTDMSVGELCEEFGCSKTTLYKYINKYGLQEELDTRYKDPDVLKQLYVERGLSIDEVAEELDATRNKVHYQLEKHDIDRRNEGGVFEDAEWRSKSTLKELYHDRGLSTLEIADRYDVTPSGVSKRMNELGIEKRQSYRHKEPSITLNQHGYERYATGKFGYRDSVFIHRLVVVAEGADPHKVFGDLSHVVHHKNEIPWDNRPENLEVVTQSEHKKIHGNQYTD
ncbi:hypothetical protein OSG_eHP1_00075 [environmental Halophage eHP-1]|nr:hypothetical protein OSG_eHP1_00075 [environmental Halophage eHP-1]